MEGKAGIGGQGAGGKGTNSVRAQPAAPNTKTAAKATVLLLEIITPSLPDRLLGFLALTFGCGRRLIGARCPLFKAIGDSLQTATLAALQLRIEAGIACAQHIERDHEGDDNASQRIQRPALNPREHATPASRDNR